VRFPSVSDVLAVLLGPVPQAEPDLWVIGPRDQTEPEPELEAEP
jgi:hypothetical protein